MRVRRAFTLIELVVAMFIILVSFLAVARINPTGYRGAAVTTDHLMALRIARNVIDSVRSRPFGADPSVLLGKRNLNGDTVEGSAVGREFEVIEVRISPYPIPATLDVATVSVTVKWRQGVGSTDSSGHNTLTVMGGLAREP